MKIKELLTKKEFDSLKILKFDDEVVLFHEQEKCESVCYVISGEVDIVSYSYNGEENIISKITDDEFFANALIFSKSPYYLGEVVAKKKTSLILIRKDKLLELFKQNEDFLEFYLQKMSDKTIYMSSRNKLLAHKNIRDRILYYFEINQGRINMSIAQLSRDLILPRPSVSREVSKMIQEGLIIKRKKVLILK